MTASSMNAFLKKYFENSPDYRLLTQRMINNAYMEYMQLNILEEEDRQLLKEMTQIMFNKKMEIDENNISEDEGDSPNIERSHSKKINKHISDSEDNLSENMNDSCKNIETNTNISKLDDKILEHTNQSKIVKENNSDNITKISNKSHIYMNLTTTADSLNSDIDSNISDIEAIEHAASDTEKKSSDDNNDKNIHIIVPNKKKRKSRSPSPSSISQSDSNDTSGESISIKKKRKKGKTTGEDVELMMLAADGSSDEEMSINQLKSRIHSGDKKLNSHKKDNTEKKTIKMGQSKEKAPEKSQRLKHVEKIARICGIIPVGVKYTRTFEGCKDENDKIKVIKQLLREAGMDGKISIEKAEIIKLKKEAAELNTSNILSSNGRGVRNVHSAFSRHQKQPEPIDRPPLKNKLQNLRDIIDSDSE